MKRTLLPYQKTWVADRSGLKIIEKSRRIGLSWCEAYACVMHAGEGGGNVYYQSYSKEMTRGFIDDCAEWARVLNIGASAVGEEIVKDGGKDIQTYRIDISSGKHIVAMTSAPRAFRSKGRPGDWAVIDEAAFVDDLEQSIKAALAFRIWGGSVHILSTHNGKDNLFNRMVQKIRGGEKPGGHHKVTLKRALREGLYRRICKVSGKEWSAGAEAEWEAAMRDEYGAQAAEELDCIPSAGTGSWLSWGDIAACQNADAGDPEKYTKKPVYIGVDVARRHDLWVAAVIEQVDKYFWLRELVVRKNIRFSEQREIIGALIKAYRPVRVAVDQTGMGEAVVEGWQDRFGRKIEGVVLTAPRKLDVATALREAFEDHRIRVPDDRDLRDDLHSVRSEAGPNGNDRLVAERGKTDGHADRFWAIALAISATVNQAVDYDSIQSIPDELEAGLAGYGGGSDLSGYM